MRLADLATTVHPAESQKVLIAAYYFLILRLTPCPYDMTKFNIFYSLRVKRKS
jgi:hypothetical protein